MDSAGPLRWCGRCLSRGWVAAQRHLGDGHWQPCKGLCPTCSGLSVRDVDALRDQAADERWLRRRYPGTERSCWDTYDWIGERWMDERDRARRSA